MSRAQFFKSLFFVIWPWSHLKWSSANDKMGNVILLTLNTFIIVKNDANLLNAGAVIHFYNRESFFKYSNKKKHSLRLFKFGNCIFVSHFTRELFSIS